MGKGSGRRPESVTGLYAAGYDEIDWGNYAGKRVAGHVPSETDVGGGVQRGGVAEDGATRERGVVAADGTAGAIGEASGAVGACSGGYAGGLGNGKAGETEHATAWSAGGCPDPVDASSLGESGG